MKRYAIDIVILPPDPVMDLAITWNQELLRLTSQPIRLNKKSPLPHLSLLMGCVEEAQLEKCAQLLAGVANRHTQPEINVSGLQIVEGLVPTLTFDVRRAPELMALHEDIVASFSAEFKHEARAEDVNDLPPISTGAIDWINQFLNDQTGDKFWPHITIGHGHPHRELQSFSFQATHIAICHLGNHCTCTEILAEAWLVR